MRLYVKAVGTSITFIDIDNKVKFTVSPAAAQKLLGVEVQEGEVWDVTVTRREEVERAFNDFQQVQTL